MPKFPTDAPIDQVIKARRASWVPASQNGQSYCYGQRQSGWFATPLTMPNHRRIKSSTLRTILTQGGISRDEFLEAYEES